MYYRVKIAYHAKDSENDRRRTGPDCNRTRTIRCWVRRTKTGTHRRSCRIRVDYHKNPDCTSKAAIDWASIRRRESVSRCRSTCWSADANVRTGQSSWCRYRTSRPPRSFCRADTRRTFPAPSECTSWAPHCRHTYGTEGNALSATNRDTMSERNELISERPIEQLICRSKCADKARRRIRKKEKKAKKGKKEGACKRSNVEKTNLTWRKTIQVFSTRRIIEWARQWVRSTQRVWRRSNTYSHTFRGMLAA